MRYPMDERERRVLDLATVSRVRDDALTADDLVFSPFGCGVVSGQMSVIGGQLGADPGFVRALDRVSDEHSAAFYGYIRSMIAFGYQLARDDRGERP